MVVFIDGVPREAETWGRRLMVAGLVNGRVITESHDWFRGYFVKDKKIEANGHIYLVPSDQEKAYTVLRHHIKMNSKG